MRIWLGLLSILVCCAACGSDIIYFKDGKSVKCKILSETPGRIIYTAKGVRHEIARSTVDKIEHVKELLVDARGDENKVACNDKDKKDDGKGDDNTIPNPDEYKKGYVQGLAAHYYMDPTNWGGHWMEGTHPTVNPRDWTLTKYAYTAIEPHINHRFVHKGWFTIRWQGKLIVGNPSERCDTDKMDKGGEKGPLAADVEFEAWADDGCTLTIDDQVVFDDWVPCPEDSPKSHRVGKISLTKGVHTIAIDYFQGESLKKNDKDPIKLYWQCDEFKIPHQIIPAAHFCHGKLDLVPKKGREDKDTPTPTFKNRLVDKKNDEGGKKDEKK